MNVKYKTPLDRYMSEQNVKDSELSRYTGVPQPTITRYRNRLRPHAHEDKLQLLADWLGVTVAELRGKPIGDELPPEAKNIAKMWLALKPPDRKRFRALLETWQSTDPDNKPDPDAPLPPKPHR